MKKYALLYSGLLLINLSLPRAYADNSNLYFYGGIGYAVTNNEDGTTEDTDTDPADTNPLSIPFSHSDELTLQVGLGYELNRYISVELSTIAINDIDITFADQSDTVKTNIDSKYLMANIFWNFNTPSVFGFKPYMGAGLGAAQHSLSNIRFNFDDGDYADIYGRNKNTLAYQVLLGARKSISENMQWDIRYTYLDGGTAESQTQFQVFDVSDGDTDYGQFQEPIKIDMKSHTLTLNLRYYF